MTAIPASDEISAILSDPGSKLLDLEIVQDGGNRAIRLVVRNEQAVLLMSESATTAKFRIVSGISLSSQLPHLQGTGEGPLNVDYDEYTKQGSITVSDVTGSGPIPIVPKGVTSSASLPTPMPTGAGSRGCLSLMMAALVTLVVCGVMAYSQIW